MQLRSFYADFFSNTENLDTMAFCLQNAIID